ncbi:hypothetical protein NDN08_006099 [Rhodosorus marinus]|uniref:Pentacotripeptide-repeat region of PRORP domain-containing protein n=1 Tax=Rhodosorus marinus TaxID=101924 RepID=A0AAV8UJT8_9RHOD|nr:hypothetical protein NDN08_006099 [Rhodosorus marinus]
MISAMLSRRILRFDSAVGMAVGMRGSWLHGGTVVRGLSTELGGDRVSTANAPAPVEERQSDGGIVESASKDRDSAVLRAANPDNKDSAGTMPSGRRRHDRDKLHELWEQALKYNMKVLRHLQSKEMWSEAKLAKMGRRVRRTRKKREPDAMRNQFKVDFSFSLEDHAKEMAKFEKIRTGGGGHSITSEYGPALPGIPNPFQRAPLGKRINGFLDKGREDVAVHNAINNFRGSDRRGSARTMLDVMFILGRRIGVDSAEKLYNNIRGDGWMTVEHRALFLQALMRVSAYNGDQKGMEKWRAAAMNDSGVPYNAYAYNSEIIYHIAVGNMEQAEEVKRKMQKAGVNPTPETFTHLVEGYCDKSDKQNVAKTMQEMFNRRMTPEVDLYRKILKFCKRVGDLAGAKLILNRIRKSTLLLPPWSYPLMMELHLELRDYAGVAAAFSDLLNSSYDATKTECRIVRQACAECEDPGVASDLLRQFLMMRVQNYCGTEACIAQGCDEHAADLVTRVHTLDKRVNN